jgi:hypothetical protein
MIQHVCLWDDCQECRTGETMAFTDDQLKRLRIKNKPLPCPFCGELPVVISENQVIHLNFKCLLKNKATDLKVWNYRPG